VDKETWYNNNKTIINVRVHATQNITSAYRNHIGLTDEIQQYDKYIPCLLFGKSQVRICDRENEHDY